MHDLDPESAEELDQLCEALGRPGEQLKRAVDRVCADPSGQHNPRHSYTKRFHSPHRYVNVGKKARVMEFTTSHWRGLFRTAEIEKDGVTHRLIAFIPVKGRRFFSVKDCPWH